MVPSAYALACWESSSCSSCLHGLLASSVAPVSSPSCQNPRENSLPVRKTGRRVREALLNLPPYPPSVRVLLRVQSCFQSLLIQSDVSSPAEKAPSCLGRKPSSLAGRERPRIVAQLRGIHARSLLCRS